MQVVSEYPDGVFCLGRPGNHRYRRSEGVLWWPLWMGGLDVPTDRGIPYTMFQIEGKNVAAASPMMPDMAAQGVPSHWSSYVKHSDADAVAAKSNRSGWNADDAPDGCHGLRPYVFRPGSQRRRLRRMAASQPHQRRISEYPQHIRVWKELQTRD